MYVICIYVVIIVSVHVWLCRSKYTCTLVCTTNKREDKNTSLSIHNSGFANKIVFSTGMTGGNNGLYEYNLETRTVAYLITNLQSDVYSITYDYSNGYIYFPRLHKNDIQR